MNRFCSNCQITLNNEPALEGVDGMLCFPCRYRLDEAGGQQFLTEMKAYQPLRERWERMHGKQWRQFQKLQDLVEKFNIATGVGAVGFFVSLATTKSFNLVALLAIATVVSLVMSYITSFAANKLRCEPPPVQPKPNRHALNEKPKLIFGASDYQIGQPAFDIFDRYPPDWSERQAFVLRRDGNRCRLCGKTENLHVHHIWPVSFSSNHTPQNLITLCRSCHMKQQYWEHSTLVSENIKAKKKYFVRTYTRSDGTVVEGHKRKVGRRGGFWERVRGERQSLKNKTN